MLETLLLILKGFGYLLLATLIYQTYSYIRVVRKIKHYEALGVAVMPGAYIPFFGNMSDLAQY